MPLRWVVMLGMTCTRSEQSQWCEQCEQGSSGWSFSKTSVGLFNPLILFPGLHIFLTWDLCVLVLPVQFTVPSDNCKKCTVHILFQTQQDNKLIISKTKNNKPQQTFRAQQPSKRDTPKKPMLRRRVCRKAWSGVTCPVPNPCCEGGIRDQPCRRWGWVLESGGRWCLRHFFGMRISPTLGDMSAYVWALKILRRLSAWVLIWNLGF